MAQIREIKKRIRSIESTKKITRTMELVATSKMKKAQDRVLASRPYAAKLRGILRALSRVGKSVDVDHPLLRRPDTDRRVAVFLIASNRGMCGAYNANVIRLAQQFRLAREEEGREVELHVSGKKAVGYFRYRGMELASSYVDPSDQPRFEHAEEIAGAFTEAFGQGRIDRLVLVYTRFVSAGRLTPVVETLLPISEEALGGDKGAPDGSAEGEGAPKGDVLFEPDPVEIISSLLPLVVKMRFFEVLLNAQASEQSARMVAMKMATDNAGELIHSLTRVYNRERQAQITQELAEILGGVEALKG